MGNNEAFDGMPQRRPVSRSLGLRFILYSLSLTLSVSLPRATVPLLLRTMPRVLLDRDGRLCTRGASTLRTRGR